MKYIKIFIASSLSEFRQQRYELGDYIRSLNDIYVRRGIYFELVLSEDLPNMLAAGRKQDELNQIINDCQYFYILIGRRAGGASLEEFDTALKKQRESGLPHIYTYFYQSEDGRTPEQSTIDFMEMLDKKLGHYYSFFDNIDSVKLNLLIELARDESVGSSLTIRDGYALAEGKSILPLERIPVFGRHEELQRMLAEKEETEARLLGLRKRLLSCPDDEDTFGELLAAAQRRDELASLIRQIETDILNLCTTIRARSGDGKPMSLREKEAGHLLDLGDFDGALRILRDEQRKKELEQAEQVVANGQDRIAAYISENRLQIQALKSKGITEKTIPEIQKCYEENMGLAERHHICTDVFYDYACFLMNHNQHEKAIRVLERSLQLLALENAPASQLADSEYLLACLMYKSNRIEEAKALHASALERREKLMRPDDARSVFKLASSCNQIGYLFFRLHHDEEAEAYLSRAAALQEQLLKEDVPLDARSAYALSLNNLAQLAQRKGQLDTAEQYQLRAMALREELAADNSVAARGFLAMSCLNYARLLESMEGEQGRADAYYRKAVDLYSALSEEDTKHLVDKAIASYHYARFLERTDRERAMQIHLDALRLRRMLAKGNSAALRSDLSDSCFAIGRLLAEQGEPEAAAYLREALSLQKELYEAAPEKYVSYQQMKETAQQLGISP